MSVSDPTVVGEAQRVYNNHDVVVRTGSGDSGAGVTEARVDAAGQLRARFAVGNVVGVPGIGTSVAAGAVVVGTSIPQARTFFTTNLVGTYRVVCEGGGVCPWS